ncbi:MAG: tetratricopeptide repeat protein [Dokdonella sp.]|uniref:tetratricopeptide repeat protein n=1 Tax=Dokdonella sp. TaxID=2291710 RepID=UPI0032664EA0
MLKESIDLHRQGRFDEAEKGYREQLADHPDDVDALHLLGMLRHQLNDAGEGNRLLARAHALSPDNPAIELSLASLAFRDGDHDTASKGFARALKLDPNLAGAHAGAGQIALLQGQSALAEEHFRIALRADEEPHALAGLGALMLERGDLEAALRHIGRAADLAPHDALIQMQLGEAFSRRDTPAFAEQAYLNALRLRPSLHHARHKLASLLIKTRRIAEAQAHHRELLDVPEFAVLAHLGLGDAARVENRFDDAAASYRAALAIEPTHVVATKALAWSLAQSGRTDDAIAAYDDAVVRLPHDEELKSARADLLTLVGRLPDAGRGWDELVKLNPANLFARGRLAMVAEYLGDTGAAQAHAGLVLAARDDAEMLLIRIRGLLRGGDLDNASAALDVLGRYPSLSPGQTSLRWNYLGRLHDRRAEPVDAVRCFSEAQKGYEVSLPPLADPRPELNAALTEGVGAAWPLAPVLLLGTPGSGVERIAALLADQPQLIVLRDRIGTMLRDDDFSQPRFPLYSGALGEEDRAALRERYLAPLYAAGIAPDRPIVDWLPRWDAHLLALVRRAMPGTRLLIVERDPRDALINWLAFGWAPGFPCADPDSAADWLQRARMHLQVGHDLDQPHRLVVGADPLLDGQPDAGDEVARFLGIEPLSHGVQLAAMMTGLGGLPVRFPAGHWKNYRDALAPAFAKLMV